MHFLLFFVVIIVLFRRPAHLGAQSQAASLRERHLC